MTVKDLATLKTDISNAVAPNGANLITAAAVRDVMLDMADSNHSGFTNVVAEGATGDGVTDDTVAVQAAVDGGGQVFFPDGTYLCSQLNLVDGLELIGESRVGAILKFAGGTDQFLWASGDENVTVRNLTVDGNNDPILANRGLISFFSTSGSSGTGLVENCLIKNSTYHGIMQFASALVIRDTEIHDCAWYGIYGHGSIASNIREGLSVENCVVHDCDRNGIQVGSHGAGASYDASVSIINNYVYNIDDADATVGQQGNGILIFQASNAQLIGNHITRCYSGGIRVNDADEVTILGGRYGFLGEVGIFVELSAVGCIIDGANVEKCRNVGIIATNQSGGGDRSVIANCHVQDIGVAGFGFGGSTALAPVDHGFGIFSEFGRVSNCTVIDVDGTVSGTGIGGGVGNAAKNIRISGNEIRDVEYGIRVANGGAGKAGPVFVHDNDMYSVATSFFEGVGGATKAPGGFTGAATLDVYFNNNYPAQTDFQTFADQDATPSVLGLTKVKTANTIATTITDFDNAHEGQEIVLVAGDANTTIDFSASSLKGNGGVDKTLAVGDLIRAVHDSSTGNWHCTIGDA